MRVVSGAQPRCSHRWRWWDDTSTTHLGPRVDSRHGDEPEDEGSNLWSHRRLRRGRYRDDVVQRELLAHGGAGRWLQLYGECLGIQVKERERDRQFGCNYDRELRADASSLIVRVT